MTISAIFTLITCLFMAGIVGLIVYMEIAAQKRKNEVDELLRRINHWQSKRRKI